MILKECNDRKKLSVMNKPAKPPCKNRVEQFYYYRQSLAGSWGGHLIRSVNVLFNNLYFVVLRFPAMPKLSQRFLHVDFCLNDWHILLLSFVYNSRFTRNFSRQIRYYSVNNLMSIFALNLPYYKITEFTVFKAKISTYRSAQIFSIVYF